MDLKCTMLTEGSQSQRLHVLEFYLNDILAKAKQYGHEIGYGCHRYWAGKKVDHREVQSFFLDIETLPYRDCVYGYVTIQM